MELLDSKSLKVMGYSGISTIRQFEVSNVMYVITTTFCSNNIPTGHSVASKPCTLSPILLLVSNPTVQIRELS